MDGGTFQDRLAHPLPLDEVLRVTEPLADALDYAHSQGIIHRNIKPSNVLLDSVGRVKLGDFETEIMADRSHPATSESTFVGAAPYTSPEQALGRRADRKSDLYSLGVLLYQMIVGEVPFRKETVTSTLRSQIHDTVPSPSWLKPDLDPRLDAILEKALAKNPDDRYRSAGELIDALRTVVSDSTQPENSLGVVGISTLAGAIGLAIANSVEVGISGGGGFITGFVIGLLLLYGFAWLKVRTEQHSQIALEKTRITTFCPECQAPITMGDKHNRED